MSRAIFNQDTFSKKLYEELAWRRKELNIIKNYIPTKANQKQAAAIRFNTAMLYAHFEGFIKTSSELYLKYVSKKHLKHSELKTQFISLSISKKVKQLETNSIRAKTEIIDFILENLNAKSNVNTDKVINTKSNLRFDVFSDILYTLDLNEEHFKHYTSLIDDLVDARNYIAHGEYLRIDYKTFLEMYNDINEVFNIFKNEIENSVVQKRYSKIASP